MPVQTEPGREVGVLVEVLLANALGADRQYPNAIRELRSILKRYDRLCEGGALTVRRRRAALR